MRIQDKQRFFDAVNHIENKEVPFMEIDPDMHIVNQIMGKKYDMGLHCFEMPIKDYVELNKRMGNDIAYFSHIWRLGRKEMTDKDGRVHYVDGFMKTPDSLKDITFPSLDEWKRKLDELCNELSKSNMGLMCGTQTAAFTTMSAMGYQDFLMNTLMDKQFVTDFINRLHEYCIKEMEVTMQYPVDALKMSSGLVYNTGPMIDMDSYKELEFNYLAEQCKLTKDNNKIACFHIDGKLDDLIEDIISIGVDIINPIDPCSGAQSIYDIKERYGDRITISGNIDIDGVLLNGTPEEVKEDVIKHIKGCSKGGGYIVSSSHNLHELVPLKNFYAMRDACLNY